VPTNVDFNSIKAMLKKGEEFKATRRMGPPREKVFSDLAPIIGGVEYSYHNGTFEDAKAAVLERMLCVTLDGVIQRPPESKPGVWAGLKTFSKAIAGHIRSRGNPVPLTEQQFAESYKDARRRTRYLIAVEDLKLKPVCREDAWLSLFLKSEKTAYKAKRCVARVISPRSPRYNVCVGRYLRTVEHGNAPGSLYWAIDQVFGAPTVAKNLNASQVAHLIVDSWGAIDDPIALSLDAKRFDQHCGREALRFEHGVYNRVFRSPELMRLLSWQLDNIGRLYLKDGKIKVRVARGRMSGDMNTSCGNVIIMCALIWGYAKSLGIRYRLVNNGDDSVLIVSKSDLPKLARLQEWFHDYGYTMKIESTTTVLEQVVFCQSQPVHGTKGWVMVRQLNALAKDNVTDRDVRTEASWNSQRGAIADCGLALTDGLPMLPQYYKLLKGTSKTAAKNTLETGMQWAARGMENSESEVSVRARVSFWRAFGISPFQQVAAEEILADTHLRYWGREVWAQRHEEWYDMPLISRWS
jgi:hypothetical protein